MNLTMTLNQGVVSQHIRAKWVMRLLVVVMVVDAVGLLMGLLDLDLTGRAASNVELTVAELDAYYPSDLLG
jgi:hypothetical protein